MSKSQDLQNQLAHSYATSQENCRYFLMAIAASAIGFTFTQLKIEPASLSHVPVALSVALWAASFQCGIKTIEWITGIKGKNAFYLRRLNFNPEHEVQLRNSILSEEMKHSKKVQTYSNLQNSLLISGAISYSLYYIIQILSVSP